MLHYSRSAEFGYIRILELEGIGMRTLTRALDKIARDFDGLKGFIIDIRDNPGGDDSTAIAIINRFCDRKRVAFRRKTKIGPGKDAFTPVTTWHLHPKATRFVGPIVLLTSILFSAAAGLRGDEAVAIRYDRGRSHQRHILVSARFRTVGSTAYRNRYYLTDHVCYEGKGMPADIELLNTKADLRGVSIALITRALEVLKG
jgi:hypothetical protein